ncbi:MAG: hypothetical protein ACKO0Z_05035 [Betaproteobacteria bacterium]
MIETIYIQAPSKKAFNQALADGDSPAARVARRKIEGYADGTVVKFWSKRDPWGTPIAKSYGNIKAGRVV